MEAAWIDRLERKLGFAAIPGIPGFLAGMTAAVGILALVKPDFAEILTLAPDSLLTGQWWRAITFLIVPPFGNLLWLGLWLLFLYSCLSALETAWSDFKLTLFLAIGLLATVAGALITRVGYDDSYIILAAFLAFARLLPDRELYVMFVLPVKMRWLAVIAGLWTALGFVLGATATRVEIIAGLLPYFAFFGPGHSQDAYFAIRRWRSGIR